MKQIQAKGFKFWVLEEDDKIEDVNLIGHSIRLNKNRVFNGYVQLSSLSKEQAKVFVIKNYNTIPMDRILIMMK